MDKRREVLEKFVDMITDGQHIADGITMEIDAALTELDKLEKEKMLKIVGEDKLAMGFPSKDRDKYLTDIGYNQAKAEIRKKINQPQDKERA